MSNVSGTLYKYFLKIINTISYFKMFNIIVHFFVTVKLTLSFWEKIVSTTFV